MTFSKMEGELEKKKPDLNLFAFYQKRYFVIRDQGTLLVYYGSKPTSNTKTKGIL
jgi:hypothetical protein